MAKTMRSIAAVGGGKVQIVRDVPMPVPGPYESLVKVRSCGFCSGTDFHIIRGEMAVPVDPFPTLLGHEGIGDIVETGAKVRYHKVGDRFMNPVFKKMPGLQYGVTWGAMSDYCIVQDQRAMREDGLPDSAFNPSQNACRQIPNDLDPIDMGVLLTLNECFSAARNFTPEGKDILVYGAGPMGLATMKYLRYLGAKTITCVDCIDERLALAKSLSGADEVINFATQDKDALLEGRLFDRVIDIVGLSSLLMEGSHRLRPYGIVGSMGVLRNTDAVLDVTRLKNNTLLQMLNFPYGQYDITAENVALIRSGFVNPKDFYTHVCKVEQIDEVLELVRSKQALKVVLDFDD